MDLDILKAIVQSCEEVINNENPEECDKSFMEQKFPVTDRTMLATLTKSFTNLISYKVSQEAHQRYSVRLHVIEVLREWLRPPSPLQLLHTFSQGGRVVEFTARILKKYLINDILFGEDTNIDILVDLANALLTFIQKNKSFVPDLERLLEAITARERTENNIRLDRLLAVVLKDRDALKLSPRTVEKLFVYQCLTLIEQPLVDNFIAYLRNSIDSPTINYQCSYSLEELLNASSEFPTIFHIASSVLKEIFVFSNYSSKVLDYIKFFRDSVNLHCKERRKTVNDLYPLRLQSYIILLEINTELYSLSSREYVLTSLENIHTSNPDEALILLSHFPSWLQIFSNHLVASSRANDLSSVTNMSVDDMDSQCSECGVDDCEMLQ